MEFITARRWVWMFMQTFSNDYVILDKGRCFTCNGVLQTQWKLLMLETAGGYRLWIDVSALQLEGK